MWEVTPDFVAPSIQSAPLGFKPRVNGPDIVGPYTPQTLRLVGQLIALAQRTGWTIHLALEPEPHCFLETTEETIACFKDRLYVGSALETIARPTGLSRTEAEAALHNHLGIVFEFCHRAVEFEDISASLRALVDAGVPAFKLQEASALRVPEVTADMVEAMQSFTDTVYLIQTVEM